MEKKKFLKWVTSGKLEDLKTACLELGLNGSAKKVQGWIEHEKTLLENKEKYTKSDYDARNRTLENIRATILDIVNPVKTKQ